MIRMIPPIVIAIPLLMYYAILIPFATDAVFGTRISLFDTRTGVSLLYITISLPFVLWMMLSFIEEVPYTREHAARLMGASRMYTIWKVILPLFAPGMVVTFLFISIMYSSQFLLPMHPTHTTLLPRPPLT